MTLEIFRYHIAGTHGRYSTCKVRSWKHGDNVVAVVTEIPGNPGPSVTNSAEDLWRTWCTEHGHKLEDVVKFEHYPRSAGFEPTLDGVKVTKKAGQYAASWFPVTRTQFHEMTGKTMKDAGLD